MKRYLFLFCLALAARAQQFVIPQPDCLIFFHFTVTGQTSPTSPNAGLDNRTNGCTTWNISYTSVTITTATVTLQSAPNTATGIPGTWVTYAGQTVINGANPLSVVASPSQGFSWIVGYNPWVRVLLTITGGPATGVVDGAAYGWRIPSAGSASTASSNVNVAQWGGAATSLGQKTMANSVPVAIASDQGGITANQGTAGGAAWPVGGLAAVGVAPSSNPIPQGELDSSGNLITPDYCTLKATFGFSSSSGSVQLVAVSGSTTVRICHVSFSGDTVTNLKLVSGTGSSCTSPANETGTYQQVLGFAFDWASPLITTAAKTICINSSASVTGGGTVIYSQR